MLLILLCVLLFFVVCGIAILSSLVNALTHQTKNLEVPAVSWREGIAVLLGIAAADFGIYQTICDPSQVFGPAGFAAFLAVAPLILWFGSRSVRFTFTKALLVLMIWCAAWKVLFSGSSSAFFCALLLIQLLAMAGTEARFTVRHALDFINTSIAPGRICRFFMGFGVRGHWTGAGCAAVFVPIALVLIFVGIFLAANPTLGQTLLEVLKWIRIDWRWLPRGTQIIFWIPAGLFFSALLAPRIWNDEKEPQKPSDQTDSPAPAPQYAVCRNTLWAVVGVFAAEIAWEVGTMLYWDPPVDFCYGTFCHQGAAWLTTALLLATGVLELIFRPSLYRDPRVTSLQIPAVIWTFLCALLACVIYWRLGVYAAQTGLTTLRVIGFFGTTAVVGGLGWMLLKILLRRNFNWLLRRYVGTVCFLTFFFCALPVQTWIWQFNCARIQAGNYGPTLHLTAQFIPLEGKVQLFTLLSNREPVIAQGTAALLAHSAVEDEPLTNWRSFNFVRRSFLRRQKTYAKVLEPYQRHADPQTHENPVGANAWSALSDFGLAHYQN